MTPNRGRGNVNHPANEQDGPGSDGLWEQLKKKFPEETDQVNKVLLSIAGDEDNNHGPGNIADDPFRPNGRQLLKLLNRELVSEFNKLLKNAQVPTYKNPVDFFEKLGVDFFEKLSIDVRLGAKDIENDSTNTAYAVELKGTEVVDGVEKPFTKTTGVILCKNPDAAQ